MTIPIGMSYSSGIAFGSVEARYGLYPSFEGLGNIACPSAVGDGDTLSIVQTTFQRRHTGNAGEVVKRGRPTYGKSEVDKVGEQDRHHGPRRYKDRPFPTQGKENVNPLHTTGSKLKVDSPIGVPSYSQPDDVFIWQERPQKIDNKKEIG